MKTVKAVQDFLEAKQDLSPRTLEQYTWALDHLQRECPQMPQDPKPVRKALNKFATPWTRDACWRAWKSFFHWCCLEYQFPNPMDRVKRPETPDIEMRALEPVELAHVLAAAGTLQEKAIVSLALDSGIRASEFGRLRASDIGTETLWVWGKGQKRVQVPINRETRWMLQALIDQESKDSPESLLFLGHNGQPISRFTVYRIVRRCMDKAGIGGPKRGPHCLRHSLGTRYIASGGDPFTLKRIMRHRNIATTQKYVNLAMHTVVEQHHRHSPLQEALRASQGVLIEREVEEILVGKGVNSEIRRH